MDERQRIAPAEMKTARDLARKSDRLRLRRLRQVLNDIDDDPDTENRLDAALSTHPGPEAAAMVLFGAVSRLIDELSAVTKESRIAIVDRILR